MIQSNFSEVVVLISLCLLNLICNLACKRIPFGSDNCETRFIVNRRDFRCQNLGCFYHNFRFGTYQFLNFRIIFHKFDGNPSGGVLQSKVSCLDRLIEFGYSFFYFSSIPDGCLFLVAGSFCNSTAVFVSSYIPSPLMPLLEQQVRLELAPTFFVLIVNSFFLGNINLVKANYQRGFHLDEL